MFWAAGKRVRDDRLALCAGQLALLLDSGISLPSALEILSGQSGSRYLRRILLFCRDRLMAGDPLWSALSESGGIPSLFCGIVRAGEENGRLSAALTRLSAYYGNRRRMRERVQAALIYPAFLILLALAVGWIAAAVLLPAMASLLSAIGGDLPVPTRILLAVYGWIAGHPAAILLTLLALILLVPPALRLAGRVRIFSAVGLRLPVIGRILRLSAAAQFAGAMALLTDSGIALTQTLRVCAGVIRNRAVRRAAQNAADRLESGERLGDALRECGAFPPMLCEMARVGWESGRLAETMSAACGELENDLLSAADRALALLEPLLILLTGLLVAFLMLAVFVPFISAYSTIGAWI